MNQVLFQLTLRNLRRSKRLLFAGIISFLPMMIGLLLLADSSRDNWYPLFDEFISTLIPMTGGLAALIMAGGLMSDEVEDRTISYLLVCPVSRRELFWSRALAVSLILLVLGLIQGLGMYVADVLSYMVTDQGVQFEAANGLDADRYLAAGFAYSIILPPIMMVGYGLLAGMLSLVAGKWHIIPVLAIFALDVGFSFYLQFPLGPMSAAAVFADGGLELYAPNIHWVAGLLMLPAYTVLYAWIGMFVVERKDFNVTSAVT